jgi:uroporphyrinogen-III synthase
LQELLDSLAGESLRLLRLAGRERVPLHAPPGIAVETAIAYESMPLPLPPSLAQVLRDGALVLLHSAAAARHFAGECDRLAIHRRDMRLAALSPRVAEAAGGGWAALRSAAAPNQAALLALGREMCHNPPSG